MSDQLTFKNPHVQHLRRLTGRRSARLDAGEFVVEGATLIAEALDAGWTPVAEFVAPGGASVLDARVLGPDPHFEVFDLAPDVIERVATTSTPQPNIAVFELPTASVDLGACDLILVANQINDPGNLGTILRSAEAAGVHAVVLTPGSTDAFGPKVVRASAGAVFHVPVVQDDLAAVAASGARLVGTSSHRGVDYRDADWSPPVAIVMGSEAHGLPDDAPIDDWVAIPHQGRAESLNVAMAATLLVFAAADAQR